MLLTICLTKWAKLLFRRGASFRSVDEVKDVLIRRSTLLSDRWRWCAYKLVANHQSNQRKKTKKRELLSRATNNMTAVGFCGKWFISTCDKKLVAVHTKQKRFEPFWKRLISFVTSGRCVTLWSLVRTAVLVSCQSLTNVWLVTASCKLLFEKCETT